MPEDPPKTAEETSVDDETVGGDQVDLDDQPAPKVDGQSPCSARQVVVARAARRH